MKPLASFITGTVCLLSMAACTKTGPAGPAGPAGTAGASGNANVTSVIFTNATVPTNGRDTFKIAAITQSIVDSGAIDVYYQFNGADIWVPLPQYYYFNNNLVWLILLDFQVGQAVLESNGVAGQPTTYRFDIIASH